MITTEKQREEFEKVTRPVIKFLNDNFYPHTKVIVDFTTAELVEGLCSFRTEDYLKD